MNPPAWHEWVDCHLCGSRDHRVQFSATRSGRQVVRCRGCGLVFYNPQPSIEQALAQYSEEYFDSQFPPELAAEQERLAHRRLARIERDVGVGSLLDVGCGRGRFLAIARERGWKAAGIDASPAAVRFTAQTSGAPAYLGDLTGSRPPELDPVDVVTLWDVLEHLLDPVSALAAVPRWLKPGGLVVVQTQNANSVTAAWMGRRWEQFVEPHLYHFSVRTLRRALERAGLTSVRIEPLWRFIGEPPPSGGPRRGGEVVLDIRNVLRRLRDRVLVALGYDSFTIMVAMAHRPRGG